MKLIILGNGFDLHHKYKTSFFNFRTHLQNSKNEKDLILISKIDELLRVNKNEQKTHLLWNDFEAIIGNIMKSDSYKNHKVKNIPNLIEEFTQSFYKYLLNVTKEKAPQINKKLAEEFENASVLLTFNYTSFYSTYTNTKDINIFHLHGNLTNNDLPIIGYYYSGTYKNANQFDYSVRYSGKLIHKPALAYKQNEIDFESRINQFNAKWNNKITEIVIMGYSFGTSDNHIYQIIHNLMVQQINDNNVPLSTAKNIKLIKVIIYSFNEEESNRLIEKIKTNLTKFKRRFSINTTGTGFSPKRKDILTFELKNY